MAGPERNDPGAPAQPERLRPPRWATSVALGVVGLVAVAAVVVPRPPWSDEVCPTIGYSSALHVTLLGDTSDVAHLQVRDQDAWQPPLPGESASLAPAVDRTRGGDTWTFTLDDAPATVGLRAADDRGGVLAQTDASVDWTPVGGPSKCPGPVEGRVDWRF